MPEETENEFMKRGYLLPKGCKDLIDVLKPKFQDSAVVTWPPSLPSFPPVTGEIMIPAQMTVKELASALGKKPFLIVADLMKIGVFVTISQELRFDEISKVARMYGLVAKKRA